MIESTLSLSRFRRLTRAVSGSLVFLAFGLGVPLAVLDHLRSVMSVPGVPG